MNSLRWEQLLNEGCLKVAIYVKIIIVVGIPNCLGDEPKQGIGVFYIEYVDEKLLKELASHLWVAEEAMEGIGAPLAHLLDLVRRIGQTDDA